VTEAVACFVSSYEELCERLSGKPALIVMAPEKRDFLDGIAGHDPTGPRFRGVPIEFTKQMIPEQAEVVVVQPAHGTSCRYRFDMTGERDGAERLPF
jgi:hypothetical protein